MRKLLPLDQILQSSGHLLGSLSIHQGSELVQDKNPRCFQAKRQNSCHDGPGLTHWNIDWNQRVSDAVASLLPLFFSVFVSAFVGWLRRRCCRTMLDNPKKCLINNVWQKNRKPNEKQTLQALLQAMDLFSGAQGLIRSHGREQIEARCSKQLSGRFQGREMREHRLSRTPGIHDESCFIYRKPWRSMEHVRNLRSSQTIDSMWKIMSWDFLTHLSYDFAGSPMDFRTRAEFVPCQSALALVTKTWWVIVILLISYITLHLHHVIDLIKLVGSSLSIQKC